MAKTHKTQKLKPLLVLFFLLVSLSTLYSSSSARLLHEHNSLSQTLAASEPTLNLVFIGNDVIDSPASNKNFNHILPCQIDSFKMNSTAKDKAGLTKKYRQKISHVLAKRQQSSHRREKSFRERT
ncbi:hypothetical protein MANES_10G004500v8 [Manihot esculenta]|uniref:Uncharacterized protein n=2 Tax=Manihot esculenta TaxID=3983 RepID=A0ACB7GXG7_MANES|nr:hypothetical protein MANES_10G004500v8 [Manihot esculenta]KAG8644834.1 hypothetical protein MANES_10G004500v8 [Manihot esculenta]